jgi:proteasome alpha subunit
MFEEPFRWMEAISTRHSYVREKLQSGQPVIAVPYQKGALILSFSSQPGKIFEVYDRIAMGGMGHPADMERLRMTLLDMAHLEGFNRSSVDVNIARLLQFGIAPSLKQNFEEVQRAPYLIKLLLLELDPDGRPNFFRLNYDGYWETLKNGGSVAGHEKVMEWIDNKIDETPFSTFTLEKAFVMACKIWEEGKQQVVSDEDKNDENSEVIFTLKDAFEKWSLEAGVLCAETDKKSIYRPIDPGEIEKLKAAVL